jgi:hypothetical protein
MWHPGVRLPGTGPLRRVECGAAEGSRPILQERQPWQCRLEAARAAARFSHPSRKHGYLGLVTWLR